MTVHELPSDLTIGAVGVFVVLQIWRGTAWALRKEWPTHVLKKEAEAAKSFWQEVLVALPLIEFLVGFVGAAGLAKDIGWLGAGFERFAFWTFISYGLAGSVVMVLGVVLVRLARRKMRRLQGYSPKWEGRSKSPSDLLLGDAKDLA